MEKAKVHISLECSINIFTEVELDGLVLKMLDRLADFK